MSDFQLRLDKLGLSYLATWLEILRTERAGWGDSLRCGLMYQILSNIEKELNKSTVLIKDYSRKEYRNDAKRRLDYRGSLAGR